MENLERAMWYAWMADRVPDEMLAWAASFSDAREAWSQVPDASWLLRALELAGAPRARQLAAAALCVRLAGSTSLPAHAGAARDAIAAVEAFADRECRGDIQELKTWLARLRETSLEPLTTQGGSASLGQGFEEAATSAAYEAICLLIHAAIVDDEGELSAVADWAAQSIGFVAFGAALDRGESDEAVMARAKAAALQEMAEQILARVAEVSLVDILAVRRAGEA